MIMMIKHFWKQLKIWYYEGLTGDLYTYGKKFPYPKEMKRYFK